MRIELPNVVEEQLRDLAARQGREISVLVEEALQQYLEAAAITDVEPGDVAKGQSALLKELPNEPPWRPRET